MSKKTNNTNIKTKFKHLESNIHGYGAAKLKPLNKSQAKKILSLYGPERKVNANKQQTEN